MTQIHSKAGLCKAISGLQSFEKPKVRLEQYATPPDIAADCLWTAVMAGNIEGKIIADFGAGGGILGLGAALLGAKSVILVESESSALETAKKNWAKLTKEGYLLSQVHFLEGDILEFKGEVDTIIQNPPFGTKQKHADKTFLEQAMAHSKAVYSFHKSTSRGFITALCKDHHWTVTGVKEYAWPIKKAYSFHRKPVSHIAVGLWILKK